MTVRPHIGPAVIDTTVFGRRSPDDRGAGHRVRPPRRRLRAVHLVRHGGRAALRSAPRRLGFGGVCRSSRVAWPPPRSCGPARRGRGMKAGWQSQWPPDPYRTSGVALSGGCRVRVSSAHWRAHECGSPMRTPRSLKSRSLVPVAEGRGERRVSRSHAAPASKLCVWRGWAMDAGGQTIHEHAVVDAVVGEDLEDATLVERRPLAGAQPAVRESVLLRSADGLGTLSSPVRKAMTLDARRARFPRGGRCGSGRRCRRRCSPRPAAGDLQLRSLAPVSTTACGVAGSR